MIMFLGRGGGGGGGGGSTAQIITSSYEVDVMLKVLLFEYTLYFCLEHLQK